MSRQIIFIRHGITAPQEQGRYCGHLDPPLSAAGESQARRICHRLQDTHVDRVFGSDLQRVRQTARLAFSDAALVPLPDLREISFGAWEGHTYAEVGPERPETLLDRDFRFPAGETLGEMSERVGRAVDQMLNGTDEPLVVIAHLGSIGAAVCGLLGYAGSDFWRYRLPFGGIGTLRRQSASWQLAQGDWGQ